MNIKILIGIIIIVVITGIFVFFKGKDMYEDNSKLLELTYKKSAGIPFYWKYEIEDETVVEYVKSYVLKDENTGGKVGAPVYTNYVFKGLKPGTTTITFKLVYIDDERVDEERKHTVRVDDDLNISLVATPSEEDL